MPRLAVILPVYNGESYLRSAVQSVLAQTAADFELLVIDDGSSDGTMGILSAIDDSRLRVIRFSDHKGIVEALNCGIRESDSELIARMDADDVCLPQRFERQIAYLEAHSEIDLCGSWTRVHQGFGRIRRLPSEPVRIRARMFFGGALDHPTLIMRRSFIEQNGLTYDERYRFAEDLDFLIRAGECGKIANIPEVLLLYRIHPQQVSATRKQEQREACCRLLLRQLRTMIPDGGGGGGEEFHLRFVRNELDPSELKRAESWLLQLEVANQSCLRYDVNAFHAELQQRWFYAHARCAGLPASAIARYWRSPLGRSTEVGLLRHLGLGAKIVLARSN